MNSKIYINGIHSIAPQPCFENGFFDEELDTSARSFLQIIAPRYLDYIPGKKLRRMPKLIRLGLIGAQKALEDAKIHQIDSIIIGTGNGNISDTQKFINAILDNDEKMLVPTSFVQSTNNIVAGSIALMLQSKGYNMTYTHHSTSFEMSLLDAIMQFEENEVDQVLVGAIDEMTEENVKLKTQGDLWLKEPINPIGIFNNTNNKAALLGESSSFFVLSNQANDKSYAQLVDADLFYHATASNVEKTISKFIRKNNIHANDIDLILAGFNGVETYDFPQRQLLKKIFPDSNIAAFKQFVGEHPTASAFGMWMAAQILSGKPIPKEVYYKETPKNSNTIKTILIIQKAYLSEEDYGMILMRSV
ncbi:MAG: beta-ketoacyl synthase chain length factor [Bacteroidales bacterium]|nr:beta-ketoacyl synthase chain length factor [Bacteroidales bacterium]